MTRKRSAAKWSDSRFQRLDPYDRHCLSIGRAQHSSNQFVFWGLMLVEQSEHDRGDLLRLNPRFAKFSEDRQWVMSSLREDGPFTLMPGAIGAWEEYERTERCRLEPIIDRLEEVLGFEPSVWKESAILCRDIANGLKHAIPAVRSNSMGELIAPKFDRRAKRMSEFGISEGQFVQGILGHFAFVPALTFWRLEVTDEERIGAAWEEAENWLVSNVSAGIRKHYLPHIEAVPAAWRSLITRLAGGS